jgi:hypothetical protein
MHTTAANDPTRKPKTLPSERISRLRRVVTEYLNTIESLINRDQGQRRNDECYVFLFVRDLRELFKTSPGLPVWAALKNMEARARELGNDAGAADYDCNADMLIGLAALCAVLAGSSTPEAAATRARDAHREMLRRMTPYWKTETWWSGFARTRQGRITEFAARVED